MYLFLTMSDKKSYKCVNCGENASALYRTYGQSVLKLTKCENCKGIVDKYIEYDPVIVMIDLVLMSKEAQRHIIYNTDFKAFWKLFIILMMLETYGLWHNDSLFNIAVNTLCDIQTNSTVNTTYLNLSYKPSLPESWSSYCRGWVQEEREGSDLFIWEKDFYIHFSSTFAGILMFITTLHGSMSIMGLFTHQNKVSLIRVMKAFSLYNMSLVLALPMLVWGMGHTGHTGHTAPHTRAIHYLLVYLYSFVVAYHVFTVLYECPKPVTVLVLIASHIAKHLTTFHMTPIIRAFIT